MRVPPELVREGPGAYVEWSFAILKGEVGPGSSGAVLQPRLGGRHSILHTKKLNESRGSRMKPNEVKCMPNEA